jgi:AcrR family transcriptional regulator
MEPDRKPKKKKPTRRATPPKTYHHGDLAVALVDAAEAVLTERGVEGFTLRECARRAGVSHAAPAHHFKDAKGLLTEVAAVGFERLTHAEQEGRDAENDPKNRLLGTGIGYVRFALSHPAQFQLMFQKGLIDQSSQRFLAASSAAFRVFIENYSAVYGVTFAPEMPKDSDPSVLREWALVHGFATLAVQGQLGPTRTAADIGKLMAFTRAVFEDAQKYGPPRK